MEKQRLWQALLKGEYDQTDDVIILRDKNLKWLTKPSPLLFTRECHRGLYRIVERLSETKRPPQRGVVIVACKSDKTFRYRKVMVSFVLSFPLGSREEDGIL